LQNELPFPFPEESMGYQGSVRLNSRYILKIAAAILVTVILAGLYWYGSSLQMTHVNTNIGEVDQSAYMNYASELYKSGYTYIGGRNRMPVYPFLQSLFYNPGLQSETFFQQGKLRNLVLSMFILAVVALIFFRNFNPLHAFNAILIVAFTVFIFKAGWFQAELLFYFLNFTLFYVMWRLLQRPSYVLAILAGVVAGVAHLTKASILPGLVIWLGVAGLQHLWNLLRNRRQARESAIPFLQKSRLVAVPLVGLVFLATIFPYIQTSKRVFGTYFYNVNSTFYMWYDSWKEATNGTKAHGDRVGWPDMPADQIPSMSKYLRDHTPRQIGSRFLHGAEAVMDQVVHSYGYFKYIAFYTALLLLASAWQWKRAWKLIQANFFIILFAVVYFGVYFLLYFWYAPIVSGNRLILAQFIPLLFAVSAGLQTLLGDRHIKVFRSQLGALTAVNLIVFCILAVDIFFILTMRVGHMIGGT
jgi:hypothetical protein